MNSPPSAQPTEPSHAEGRLLALDALRGAMALAVAVYHFQVWTHVLKPGSKASSSVIAFGIHSVEGFFIISGFCFFYLYGQQTFDLAQGRAFYVKRFFRIAPLYYAVLLLNFALHQQVGPFHWARLLENLTLSFGLFHPNHSMVLGGWSIGLEYVFYLSFPALLWLARFRWAALAMCVLLVAWAWPHNFHELPGTPELQRFNAYVRLPNHAFLFVLGGVFAQLRRSTERRLSTPALAVLLVAVLAVFVRALPLFYDHFFVMMGKPRVACLFACASLVLACGMHRAGPSRLLAPFVWLGDLSYAVYLLHPLAWLITSRLLGTGAQPGLAFAAGLAITLLISTIAHYLLERPMLTLGRSLAQRARQPDDRPVVASSLPR